MPRLSAGIVLLAMLFGAPSFAETFSWVDNKGTVHFTDNEQEVPKKHGGRVRVLEDITTDNPEVRDSVEESRKRAKVDERQERERSRARLLAREREEQAARARAMRERQAAEREARARAAEKAKNEWQSIDGKFGTIRISPPLRIGST